MVLADIVGGSAVNLCTFLYSVKRLVCGRNGVIIAMYKSLHKRLAALSVTNAIKSTFVGVIECKKSREIYIRY